MFDYNASDVNVKTHKSLIFFPTAPRLREKANLWFCDCTSVSSCDRLLRGLFLFWFRFGAPPFTLKPPIFCRHISGNLVEVQGQRTVVGNVAEGVCLWCSGSHVLFQQLFGDGSTVWLASSFSIRWSVVGSGSTSTSARCGWWLICVVKRHLLLWRWWCSDDCVVVAWWLCGDLACEWAVVVFTFHVVG